MRYSFLGRSTLLLAMGCASGLVACSAILDFDALTSGDGSDAGNAGNGGSGGGDGGNGGDGGGNTCVTGPCTLWNVPCHSVFVPPDDETHAFVTRYLHDEGTPHAGLYRVDFSKDAADAATIVYEDGSKANGLPAAGIAGNKEMLVFALHDPSGGGIRKLPLIGGTGMTEEVDSAKDTLGVALDGDTFYWAHDTGVSRRVNGAANKTSWTFEGGGRYVAVDDTGVLYASTGEKASHDNDHDVLQLPANGGMQTTALFENLDDAGGITVKRLPREGDGKPVPHVFVVTATGAKVAWLKADGIFKHEELGTNDADSVAKVPGEIATDDTHVYWTMRAKPDQKAGNVYRKVLTQLNPDDPAEIVAEDHNNPNGIAVTAKWVYWCSAEGLRRIEKKP